MNPLSGNPNAAVGGIGGLAGGQIVINVAKAFGWNISTGWAMLIAAAVSYVVLFVGREGLAGVWNFVKHGSKGATPAPPSAKPGP